MQKLTFVIIVALASFGAPDSNAHHAFAAVFSGDDAVRVTGAVTKVEWTNPHVWFYVDQNIGEKTINWAFEMGSPNGLVRLGWKRKNLRPGQLVTIDGYRAKNGSAMASVKSVTTVDGRPLSGAPSKED
jgi:hypothetical protein